MIAPRVSVWLRRNQLTKSCRSFATARKRFSSTGLSRRRTSRSDWWITRELQRQDADPTKMCESVAHESMETFQTLLANRLSDAMAKAGLPTAGELTPATDPRFGDYQTNAALVLGKQRGENPRELAAKIVGYLDIDELCEPPTIAGAGFINFTLRAEAVAKQGRELLQDERLGVAKTTSPRRIVIDFGSPNVAKPMHVG